MSEIRFYHLQRQSVAQALPALLNKALQSGKAILIQTPDVQSAKMIDEALWSDSPDSFMAHCLEGEPYAEESPVIIVHSDTNPNNAQVIISLFGAQPYDPKAFDLCCALFDGTHEPSLQQARAQWRSYKDQDFALTYWQQNDKGWEKKL